jgi:hypothetical protein
MISISRKIHKQTNYLLTLNFMIMKKIYISIVCMVLAFNLNLRAQLPDGSIGPDFVGTDINGVEHHLYDYLDSGKVVIIDFFTTWCEPCWEYHNSGILDEMWELYGPDGTNEVMIFQIEVDNDCGMNELLGNGNSQGNWIEGVPFPTIDDLPNPENPPYGTIIGDLYETTYIPTIYIICPSRITNEDHYEDGYLTAAELHAFIIDNCSGATAQIDASLLIYEGPTQYCYDQIEGGQVVIQNLSLGGNLTEATIQTLLDGNIISTTEYSGNLPLYSIDTVALNPIMNLPEEAELTFFIQLDGDTYLENNEIEVSVAKISYQSEMSFTIEVQPDNYPNEFSCELLDDNGTLIYEISSLIGFGLQTFDIVVTDPACITWNIYDSYGDGICCDWGEGYIRLINTASGEEVMYVNGDYGDGTTKMFVADWATGINDYAASNTMIYPNPASDNVNIIMDSRIDQLEVINHMGQAVYKTSSENKILNIDVSQLESGIYIFRIVIGNEVITNQVIIQ